MNKFKKENDFVVSLTPYRISLGGGGTDLPFYSKLKGGNLITAAINQYCKVSIARRYFDSKILIQTSRIQFPKNIEEIDNDIIKECLRYFNIKNGVHLSTFTTIPTGIGLGSSSSFVVGIVNCLLKITGKKLSPFQIGHLSHYLERELIGFAGGVQDHYIASLGGIQSLKVDKLGKVTSTPLFITKKNQKMIENHLVIVFTNIERDSHNIINAQETELEKTVKVYDQIKEIGYHSIELLQKADIEGIGEAMDMHWDLKKQLTNNMSNNSIDEMYIQLKKLGSPGGKIVGAGGGGVFMMAVPKNVDKYLHEINSLGYSNLPWGFDFNGTRLLHS